MFATCGTFSRSYPALSDSIVQARGDMTDFASAHGMESERLDGLRIAVSEAVTNVVVHAYRADGGVIHITAAVTDGDLWILVADDGCGFQTPARTPGLGWGLALIANAADELVVAERAEGGTEIRMRFEVARL